MSGEATKEYLSMVNTYFLVQRDGGGDPHIKHTSIDDARTEAKRIAIKHPNFFVHILSVYESWITSPSDPRCYDKNGEPKQVLGVPK